MRVQEVLQQPPRDVTNGRARPGHWAHAFPRWMPLFSMQRSRSRTLDENSRPIHACRAPARTHRASCAADTASDSHRRSRHLARSETTACSRCGPTGPTGPTPCTRSSTTDRTGSALPSRPRHSTLTAPSLACGITRLFHGIPIVKSGLRSGCAGCAGARKNRCAAGTRLDFITPTCSQPLRPF